MKILTVANHIAILEELEKELSAVSPGSEIIRETDALMAGKYAFNHEVDIVFAEADMKRMNGLQLIHFVRQEHPGVLSYLIVPSGEQNEFPCLTSDEVTGIIEDSFTNESLKKELAQRAK